MMRSPFRMVSAALLALLVLAPASALAAGDDLTQLPPPGESEGAQTTSPSATPAASTDTEQPSPPSAPTAVGAAPAAPSADPPLPTPVQREAPRHLYRRPYNALSIPVLALLNSGIAAEYERFIGPRYFSVATAIGMRASGGRTVHVLETNFGLEARLWMWGKGPFSKFDRRAMIGPYLGFRFDYGISRAWADEGRVLGGARRFSESLQVGVRLAVLGHVHVTPSFGLGVRTEVDPSGRLATWTTLEPLRMGLAVGALF